MNIILGVSGGISAYKACDIISGLQATGHTVHVIMTDSAKRFITEETLAVLSKYPVYTDDFRDTGGHVTHIELAEWGDAFVIAPATANTINKIRYGVADNFLTTVALAWEGIGFIAPAMNPKMYHKVKDSIGVLNQYPNWNIINPIEGVMACGDTGIGKLEKPRQIVSQINLTLSKNAL